MYASKDWKYSSIILMMVCSISGCGYHMRQAPALPFAELALPERPIQSLDNLVPTGTTWTEILQQELGVQSPATPTVPGWRLIVLNDSQQRQIASLANDGTVREYRLYRRIRVQLQAPNNLEVFQPISIEVFRDLPYKETQRAAKELEETKLWTDIEAEIGQRIARRIIRQTEQRNP